MRKCSRNYPTGLQACALQHAEQDAVRMLTDAAGCCFQAPAQWLLAIRPPPPPANCAST